MELVTDDREALSIDLTQSKEEIKKVNFSVKEGIQYRYGCYMGNCAAVSLWSITAKNTD